MAVRALQEDGRLIYIIARKKRVVYIYYRVVLSISYFDYSSLYHYSDKLSFMYNQIRPKTQRKISLQDESKKSQAVYFLYSTLIDIKFFRDEQRQAHYDKNITTGDGHLSCCMTPDLWKSKIPY